MKIKYKFDTRVEKILIKSNEVLGVRTNKEIIQTDKIILATGGKSYPLTGSTGDGYKIAKDLAELEARLAFATEVKETRFTDASI